MIVLCFVLLKILAPHYMLRRIWYSNKFSTAYNTTIKQFMKFCKKRVSLLVLLMPWKTRFALQSISPKLPSIWKNIYPSRNRSIQSSSLVVLRVLMSHPIPSHPSFGLLHYSCSQSPPRICPTASQLFAHVCTNSRYNTFAILWLYLAQGWLSETQHSPLAPLCSATN